MDFFPPYILEGSCSHICTLLFRSGLEASDPLEAPGAKLDSGEKISALRTLLHPMNRSGKNLARPEV